MGDGRGHLTARERRFVLEYCRRQGEDVTPEDNPQDIVEWFSCPECGGEVVGYNGTLTMPPWWECNECNWISNMDSSIDTDN